MATERANDLRAFRQYIDQQLSNGGPELTLDEALINWEAENQTDEEKEDTFRAIQQGLADVDAGRTRPFEEFDREFRSKQGCAGLRLKPELNPVARLPFPRDPRCVVRYVPSSADKRQQGRRGTMPGLPR